MYGPLGLQELVKKRSQGAITHEIQRSTSIDARIDAPRVAPNQPLLHLLFAQTHGSGEDVHFTLSGNCASQPSDPMRSVQGDILALENRDRIGSDTLAPLLGSVDPFDTLPQPKCPQIQILIYHGKSILLLCSSFCKIKAHDRSFALFYCQFLTCLQCSVCAGFWPGYELTMYVAHNGLLASPLMG